MWGREGLNPRSRRRLSTTQQQTVRLPVGLYPLGSTADLAFERHARAIRLLPKELSHLLTHLSELRSVDGHYRVLSDAGYPVSPALMVSALARLDELALLVGSRELREALANTDVRLTSRPPIEVASCVTANRPQALRRNLHSYAVMKRARSPRLVVVDDTGEQRAGAEQKAVVEAVTTETRVPIHFLGRTDRRHLARHLADEANVSSDLVDFALLGDSDDSSFEWITVGATRNTVLLITAGRAGISVDDDSFWEGTRIGNTDPTWWATHGPLNPLTPYPTRAAALDAATEEPLDLIALHERFLGLSATTIPPEAVETAQFGRIGPDLAELLLRQSWRVRLTTCGFYGDSGAGSVLPLLLSHGETRERITRSKSVYTSLTFSREAVRGPRATTISDNTSFMAGHFGIDATDVLPPFFPMGRGADTVYGMSIRMLLPPALLAHLPVAVRHEPPEARGPFSRTVRGIPQHTAELAGLLMGSCPFRPVAESAESRMAQLGRYLVGLAGMSDLDFRTALRERWLGEMAGVVMDMENALELYGGEPAYWAADVRAQLEAFRSAMEATGPLVSIEAAGRVEPGRFESALKRRVGLFGNLLLVWHAIFAAAVEMNGDVRGQ